jgi:hypothetical protein
MVINSNNFNKPKNRLSSQTLILTHRTKDHDIWRWKFISWLVTGTTSWCLFYRIVFNTIIFLNCERTDNFSDLKSRPVYSITAYITLSDGHHIKILWKERQLLWPEISSSLLYNSLYNVIWWTSYQNPVEGKTTSLTWNLVQSTL